MLYLNIITLFASSLSFAVQLVLCLRTDASYSTAMLFCSALALAGASVSLILLVEDGSSTYAEAEKRARQQRRR